MIVSLEISYYPLVNEFTNPVNEFIEKISNDALEIETGKMSTIITGEYTILMKILTETIETLMEKHPSVFTIKLSNTCSVT